MQYFSLYFDKGVNKYLFYQLFSQLNQIANCVTINAQEVINKSWTKRTHLFILPGGRDLPCVDLLKNQGVEVIRNYVFSGGNFLGICAGAYFASSYIEFDKNGPLQIEGTRELCFFRGKAIGPVFGTFSYRNQCGAKIIPIFYQDSKCKIAAKSYYHGGCYFQPDSSFPHTVLATYENGLAAIVKCQVGLGQAILSGVHFEFPLKDKEEEKRRLLLNAIMTQFQKKI